VAGDNYGLLTPEKCWLCQERVRRSVQDPSRFTAQLYGTSCQLNIEPFVHQSTENRPNGEHLMTDTPSAFVPFS